MMLHKHVRKYGNNKRRDTNNDQCNGKGFVDFH